MIRMSVHMRAFRAEETDQMLRLLNGHGNGEDLVALVAEARAGNGSWPFREHDLQALVERRRRDGDGDGTGVPNGVTLQEMAEALDELEAMG